MDPPRAGLHPRLVFGDFSLILTYAHLLRALSAIRNTEANKRFVYVSCDAKNAMKNFVDIARYQYYPNLCREVMINSNMLLQGLHLVT